MIAATLATVVSSSPREARAATSSVRPRAPIHTARDGHFKGPRYIYAFNITRGRHNGHRGGSRASRHHPGKLLGIHAQMIFRRYLLLLTGGIVLSSCILGAPHFSPALASSKRRPVLPATTFPPGSGVRRVGSPELLASGDTILGPTQLVAFWSTSGLCVEIDHLTPQSRAGGCDFTPLPSNRQVRAVGAGYVSTPGKPGITEILGQVVPSARFVLIEYKQARATHRLRAIVGRLPANRRKDAGPSTLSWFGADMPGCLEGRNLRIRAFGPGKVLLGTALGLAQKAACKAGTGYKVRGSLTFGSLPSG